MNLSVLLQSLIVGACVLVAGLYMLNRYAPRFAAMPRSWLAQRLERSGHARAAHALRPNANAGGGCHSGSGDDGGACGSCGSCGDGDKKSASASASRSAATEHPLIFHRRS